jgi:hypothetical protein
MSFFVAGILRIVILEASVALLIISRIVRGDDARSQRRLDIAFRVVAVLALFSWTNYGALRGDGGLVHPWEQYHFFFGSKYLPEIGYTNIYKATFLADREINGRLGHLQRTRNLETFDEESIDVAMQNADEVRAAFSDARWREFVDDWRTLASRGANWSLIMADHGNSASPAWAIFAAPIARVVGIGEGGQKLMGLVDPLLMIVLFAFAFITFGTRPTCVMIVIWSMLPFCFDYLAGSLMRWDWLFALGMCLCFWRRGNPLTAGAFLGYAVASKIFPLFFGVALLIRGAWDLWRTRRIDRRLVRFCAGAAASLVVALVLSSAMFGGFNIWRKYEKRISVAQHERFYPNQYSFRTTFLQFDNSTPQEMWQGWMLPREIKYAHVEVEASRHPGAFLVWRVLMSLLLVVALAFADEIEALAIGPLFVFIWLVVNAYYWNMLALPALAWSAREQAGKRDRLVPLVGLHLLLAWFYLYQHLNHGYSECYFVGFMMMLLIVAYSVSASWRGLMQSRRARASQ